jgi:hypothetical protein
LYFLKYTPYRERNSGITDTKGEQLQDDQEESEKRILKSLAYDFMKTRRPTR